MCTIPKKGAWNPCTILSWVWVSLLSLQGWDELVQMHTTMTLPFVGKSIMQQRAGEDPTWTMVSMYQCDS